MASSLRASEVTMASMASERHEEDTGDAPLVGVDLAALVRVQDLQGFLQPRRVQQKLQVLLAARRQEFYNFLVALDGLDDLGFR